ncbi:MAG: MMPL family transporter [Solirubrobacterales bacterium]
MEGSSKRGRKPLAARAAGIATRAPKRVLLVAGIAIAVGAPLGLTAFDALDPYEFKDPGTDSAKASDALEDVTGVRADGSVIALVNGPARSPEGHRRVNEVALNLGEVDGIERVFTPWDPPKPTWIAEDGQSAFIVAEVDAEAKSSDIAPAAEERFEGQSDVELGGVVMADDQISDQVEKDLRRAELLAFPLLLLLSLLFFRSLVAAALPLVLGGIAIVGALAMMRAIHEVVPMTVLAINTVTALGLGLAIDYSLFILSRYREELARGAPGPRALVRTLSTAGRAVTFSGITVACAMASMLVFPQQFLYSVAIGGIAISLLCAGVALFVLPALLTLLGDRVNALAPAWLQRSAQATALPDTQGRWYRFSRWVMRHPGTIAAASAAVLVALALPAFGARFVPDDASLLPDEQSAGTVDRKLASGFTPDPQYPIITQWVSPDPGGPPPPWVLKYRQDALALDGVVAVPPQTLVGENVVRMDVFSGVGRATPETRQLVDEVRDLESPPEAGVRVGGLAASEIDEEKSVLSSLPLAAAILIVTTVCALFAMTGSLLLPLKALVMNALTLGATLGLLVLVFQNGNLEGLLGFTSPGGISIAVAIVVAVAGFGLSTDYGVFTLSRMRELRDGGASNVEAVALGLERTGRLVTSAALLFAVAIGALVTGSMIPVKETGFGLAAAVLIDSTIVRALLVPSLMALLGERNWWAPRWLRGLAMEPER